MRKRHSKHEKQLKSIENTTPVEIIRRIRIADYAAADFIESEVLATLIRNRHQQSAGVVNEATTSSRIRGSRMRIFGMLISKRPLTTSRRTFR